MTTNIRRLSFYNTAAAAEHYLGLRWPRAVWESVLTQAITDAAEGPPQWEADEAVDFVHYGTPAEFVADIRSAAQEWIDDPVNEPRRFEWVCEQLDLDPSAVRAAVARKTHLLSTTRSK